MSYHGSEEQVENLLAIAQYKLEDTMTAFRAADKRMDWLIQVKDSERDPVARERMEKEFRELICTLRTYRADWAPQARQAVESLRDELAAIRARKP